MIFLAWLGLHCFASVDIVLFIPGNWMIYPRTKCGYGFEQQITYVQSISLDLGLDAVVHRPQPLTYCFISAKRTMYCYRSQLKPESRIKHEIPAKRLCYAQIVAAIAIY